MDDDVNLYRDFLASTHSLIKHNSLSNLFNEFVDIPSQLNRQFNMYNNTHENIKNQIQFIKEIQNRLLNIVTSNAPFRRVLDFHRENLKANSKPFNNPCITDQEKHVWLRPTEEECHKIHSQINIHNTAVSKVLRAALLIVREHLTLGVDNDTIANELFSVIEESIMELPKPTICRSMDVLFLSNIEEIKAFLYSLLTTSTYVQNINELILLMYTKLGGLDTFLEWIDSAIDHIPKTDAVIRAEILYIVLQSLLIGHDGTVNEFSGHIQDCIGTDIPSKDPMTLKEAINVMLITIIRLCKIEQNLDEKSKHPKLDAVQNLFADIYIWSYGNEIDYIKSAYPDSLSTRLNSSSDKPCTKQVLCTQKKVIMVNNFGQVKSRSIQKQTQLNQCFKKALSNCWLPIQFPDLNIKITDLCVGFASATEKQHILALSKSGQLFSWGGGNCGKLGHGNTEDVKLPKLIDSLRGYNVKQISAGLNHSAAVTETGLSFVWGDGLCFNNENGELCLLPKRLKQGIMSNVICGPKCTFIVCINKRNITYMGSSCPKNACYKDHFVLPTHPIPINWAPSSYDVNMSDSSIPEKIQKVVANSFGLLVLLINGQLYSIGHGFLLGCPNCQVHKCFERVKAMLTVHVLDVAVSETHVVVLAKDVIYSWSITISTLTIIEQSLSHFVTDVSVNSLLEDNRQIIIAWSKTEEYQKRCSTVKQSNPYLYSTSVYNTITYFKNILFKCTKDDECIAYFEDIVQSSLDILVYCMNSYQFKCLWPIIFPESDKLMQILLDIHDRIACKNQISKVIVDSILLSSKVFYRSLEDRANFILNLLSSVTSLLLLSSGQQLILETLLLSFNDQSPFNQFTKLQELNIVVLDNLLITVCRILIGSVNELFKSNRSSADIELYISPLIKTLDRFVTYGYRAYLGRIQNYCPIIHNPIKNLCSLLPMVNSLFDCLKSYLHRMTSKHQIKHWILTSNAKSTHYLFSHSPAGWILFDVLFFLMEQEHFDDIYSLIPHISSTILSLNDINILLPNTMTCDAQEVGFPLYGFSTSSNSSPSLLESDLGWSWLLDQQMLAGLLYGKLLTNIVKTVEVNEDERILYWLQTPLFNHISKLEQRRKVNDQKLTKHDDDYEQMLKVFLKINFNKFRLWSKHNILYVTGLEIYSTIIELIISKYNDVDIEIILKWHGIYYIFEKIANTVLCSISKIAGKDVLNCNLTLTVDESTLVTLCTDIIMDKCNCLRTLLQESVKNSRTKYIPQKTVEENTKISRMIESLDITQMKSVSSMIERNSSTSDISGGVDLFTNIEAWRWLSAMGDSLNDFFAIDHPMAVNQELSTIPYNIMAKKTRNSRAVATVQGICKLFDPSVKLLNSVFVQIINGILESTAISQPVKTLSDEQLLILESMFRICINKLKSYAEQSKFAVPPRRLCASIFGLLSNYTFVQPQFFSIMMEENLFELMRTLVDNHSFITTDTWLIIEGNGDDNLVKVFNLIVWCTFEDFLLNLSIHNVAVADNVRFELEDQIIRFVDDTYHEIDVNSFRRIFDIYATLNLSHLLYRKTVLFHSDVNRTRWTDLLLRIATIECNDDLFNIFYSRYLINISAIDILSNITCDMNEADTDDSIENLFANILLKFSDYYYYLLITVPRLDTKRVLKGVECRLRSCNIDRLADDKTSPHDYIYGNGNFDRQRTFHCDIISSDKILVSPTGIGQFFAITHQIMSSGVWEITMYVSCSDSNVEFSCGFIMNEQRQWPSEYQSLMNLRKVIQPISLSGSGSLLHRIECVIDIDECLVYFFNVYNKVQIFSAKEEFYRFFLTFSAKSQFTTIAYEVHIASIKQLKHSSMCHVNNFYNNSGICHDNYIVRSRMYDTVTKICNKRFDLLFKLIIQPVSERLKYCQHVDVYSDRKMTDSKICVSLMFGLFVLCGIAKQHRVYRGEMCTYLSHDDSSEHIGIIVKFSTKLKSKFSGLNFVDKLIDCSEICCTIHSMSTNTTIDIPVKHLIKDEIYAEAMLTKYFKSVFPDHIDDIFSLLSNLSKCISLQFYDSDVSNYAEVSWFVDSLTAVKTEYYFIKCIVSNLFLKILGHDELFEYIVKSSNDSIDFKFHSIFQNVVQLATKPSPIKHISNSDDFLCCSLRLFEGFNVIECEIDFGIAKSYAKLFLQLHHFMDLGTELSKKDKSILVKALQRTGYSKEMIDSLVNNSSDQLSPMKGGSVTFNLRRRLLDCSVTSDYVSALQMNPTPSNEYDANPQNADQVLELDYIGAYSYQYATRTQRSIHDYFTAQPSTTKRSRICPICDLVLKSNTESLFAHLSCKHSHNCLKSFQHQATRGIDLNGQCHDIDIKLLHCATVTDKLYCVCCDYLTKRILPKDKSVDFEKFFTERFQTNPLIGWPGTMSSEDYFYQKKSEVKIYHPLKLTEVEEVSILGDNIVKEINDSKTIFNQMDNNDSVKIVTNVCEEVPFVCQLNSNAIIKALIRLEYTDLVLSSRRIIYQLIKLIYKRESRKDVHFLTFKFMLNNLSFVSDMIRLIEFGRIKSELSVSSTLNKIQVVNFSKADFLSILIMTFESTLDTQDKIHTFLRSFITILENFLTSANEYFRLNRDCDKTIFLCPSRLLTQIFTNSSIRVLNSVLSTNMNYGYWQTDIDELLELFAFGVLNDICSATDKIWCLHNITRLFNIIKKRKLSTVSDYTNHADMYDDLSSDDSQVVHLTNANVRKMISTNNRQFVVTADSEGTLRIWDIDSKIGLQQHLQQILFFSSGEIDDNGDLSSSALTTFQQNNVSEFPYVIGVQNIAMSFSGFYVTESIGNCLNIWSTKSVYAQPLCIRLPSIVTALVFPELTFSGMNGAPVDQLLVGLSNGQLLLMRVLDNGTRITQKVIKTGAQDNLPISTLTWDKEKYPIAIGYDDGSIILTDQRIDSEQLSLDTIHSRKISQLLYSPCSSQVEKSLLASCAVDEHRIAIWNNSKIVCLISISDPVSCIEWLPRQFICSSHLYIIITGTSRGLVQFWQFDESGHTVQNILTLCGHLSEIRMLKMCENTGLLATGCKNGLVNVWCINDRSLISTFRGADAVIGVEWTPHNNLAVTWSNSQYVNIWQHFNDSAFQKNGHRQWALIRKIFLDYTEASSIKHLDYLKKLILSINRMILQQYNAEDSFVKCGYSISYSQYLQALIQLLLSLELLPSFIPCSKYLHLDVSIHRDFTIQRDLTIENIYHRRILCHVLNRNYSLSRFNDTYSDVLFDVDELIRTTKGICFESSLSKDSIPKWWWNWCFESEFFVQNYLDSKWDNRYWSWDMQQELNEWYNNSPRDWIANYCSSTYIWGCGKQGELSILSKKDWEKPIELKINGIQQVVCGNALTLVITINGTLMACGEGLEIIFNPYLREQSSRMIMVPILSDFKIAHVAVSRGPESHIVAITSFGDVYSWGIGSHGKLGHGHGTSLKKPKLIEGLRGKCAIQADCGHMHTAVVTSSGKLYTFGLGAIGQLGVEILTGSDSPRLVSFDDDDVKIGYVACGSNHTLALTQDGMSLYAFGDGAFGKLGLGDFNNRFSPVRVNLEKNILLKVCGGNNFSAALSDKGEVLTWGHCHYVGHSDQIDNAPDVENSHVTTPTINSHLLHDGVTIIDISAGNDTTFAISTAGFIYGWGSNDNNLLLSASKTNVYLPELIGLTKKCNFKQISCGRYHVCASAYSPHSYRYDIPGGPQFIHNPNDDMDISRYPALTASNLNRFDLTARLVVISYWNGLIRLTWQLWLPLTNQKFSISDNSGDQIDTDWPLISPISYLLPECNWLWSSFHYFRTSSLRSLLNIDNITSATNRYIAGSMITNRTYASLVKINRIEKVESVFSQTCHQVIRMHPMELRLPWRAWKVKLVHEGADDAGGAYDETISEICTELQSLDMGLNVLIPSPSDDTMFLPNPNPDVCQDYFRFLGILMGTAIRTKKPIDLNLDPLFWKLMTKSSINVEDLRRLDPAYFNSLLSLHDTTESVESYLKEVLFIENFVVFSANREENEMVFNGRDRSITQTSRVQFVNHAIAFRLHEFDKCVAHIREGFSGVSPLLFLDLMTWSQLERAVCGSRTINVSVLKSISRYVDADENNEIFSWFWDILEHFSETEKSFFLRFVTGKSRLPFENSKIPFRLFIYLSKQPVTSLPQAQTCFNQIRLPKYTSRAELESRLKIAISQCRSIDMDDYMLTRNRDF